MCKIQKVKIEEKNQVFIILSVITTVWFRVGLGYIDQEDHEAASLPFKHYLYIIVTRC